MDNVPCKPHLSLFFSRVVADITFSKCP